MARGDGFRDLRPPGPPLPDAPVRIELPVPFPLKTVNAWLFPGDRPVLVDCGVGSSRSYQVLLEGLRKAGQDPSELTLYVTHGHVDHAGNARRLREDFGVPLHAPRSESAFIETFRQDAPDRNDAYAAALRHHGVPAEDVARIRADSDAIDRFLDDVPITADVPGHETAVFGDRDVEALHTPGHTPGSVSFRLTDDNELLTGDTLLEAITSNAVELLDDDKGRYHQYVQTLESLRPYVGVDCLPGHHAPFRLTDELLDRHLQHHRDRRGRILAALDRPRTGHQLFPIVFPGLDSDAALFMGMAEIVGHLHSLELDGLVVKEKGPGGVRRYRRAP